MFPCKNGLYPISPEQPLLCLGLAGFSPEQGTQLARWDRRPLAARGIPEHFLPNSLSQLRWIYTQRTKHDVLPPRYRNKPIRAPARAWI